MSSKPPQSKQFPGFKSLGPNILFYEPDPSSASKPDSNRDASPSLIILATWFAALPRHVQKYTQTYQSLYPTASILILSTGIPEMVYRSYSTQQASLLPCIPILKTQGKDILVHVFSNSGAHTACQLALEYCSQTGYNLSIGALIIDSAPARGNYSSMSSGFMPSLPSTLVVKQLAACCVHGLLTLIVLKETVLREENWIEKYRRELNDEEVLSSKRGRIYIYSKEDSIVPWTYVESHAREKMKEKNDVRLERWEGSMHVGHMTKDPTRYWNLVQKLWDDGSSTESAIKSQL